MKKKNLNSLTLNKKSVSNLSKTGTIIGGVGSRTSIIKKCPIGPSDDTLDFDCPSFWC
ncbi:hypothetical protein [Kordia sp.]|uniref:hypothetical protein n=1 Tax=Kordia sp. TaxID=1965332 RepID=UPI003D2B64E1